MRRSTGPVVASAILAAALLGCARSPAASPGPTPDPTPDTPPATQTAEADQIRITVVNNRTDAGVVTVHLEPAGGVRVTLGTVDAGTTRTFPHRVQGGNRTIKLVAVGATGSPVESEVVTVPSGSQLNWDLLLNAVRVRR